MWFPSHVRLVGNKLVDGGARYASLNGSIFDRPLPPCDYQSFARPVLLREWQRKWDLADTGRFAHFILPKVSLRPWFEGQKEERTFVISVSRIMSEHSSVRSYLERFRIVEDLMCVCLKDFETVDHLIWHCERFGSERHRLIDALSKLDVLHGTPLRDLCGPRKWSAIKYCLDFFGSFKIGFCSDLTISISVDVGLVICFIGPYMACGPIRIGDTFHQKKNSLTIFPWTISPNACFPENTFL
jgi:hypothetical protein